MFSCQRLYAGSLSNRLNWQRKIVPQSSLARLVLFLSLQNLPGSIFWPA